MGNCMGICESDKAATHAFAENLMYEKKNGDVFKHYEEVKLLGEGSMGSVSLVRKKVSGGESFDTIHEHKGAAVMLARRPTSPGKGSPYKEYALKSIVVTRVTDEFMDELKNEIDLLKSLDHPNIVKAYEVYYTKQNIYMVMEHCSGGDLYARRPYSEKDTAKIVGKLLSAIAYMHDKSIVHRDLKFENIMFENRSDEAEIKVIDFGLSKKYLPNDRFMTEGVGTIYTMAPQVLQGVYTDKVDVWSIGVIIYMLLSNTKPFYHRKRRFVIDMIMRCDYNFDGPEWKMISDESKDLVSSLLVLDPDKRLSAKEALKHVWLSKEYALSDRKPSDTFMEGVGGHLSSYDENSEFRKIALMIIAHKSSTEEIVELRKAFDQFDSQNDGRITYKEFQAALEKMNFTEEDMNRMFQSVDKDHDGYVYYTEFLAATLEAHGNVEIDRLMDAFDRMDSDNTGFISEKNLKSLLGTDYTPALVKQMLEEADIDGDGKISFEEFLLAFRKKHKKLSITLLHQDTTGSEEQALPSLVGIDEPIPGGKQSMKE